MAAALGRLRVLVLDLQLDAGPPRQPLQRPDEVEVLGLLDVAEDVALHPAAEAVVHLLLPVDRERRGALLVKRAAAHVVGTRRLAQLGALLHQLHEVDRVTDAILAVVAVARHDHEERTIPGVRTRVLALLVGALMLFPAVAAAQISHDGRWLTDAQGRTLILHGVNMVAKRPPYAPDALGFGADDARFLARNGFNTVRLGVIYAAVEPQPGVYDDAYLDRIARTVDQLGRQGIRCCWTSIRTSTASASRARAGPTGRSATTACPPSRRTASRATTSACPR